GLKIRPALGPKSLTYFADPIVRLTPRIDVLTYHGPGAFESLFCNPEPFWNSLRNVHVQERPFWKALGQCFPGDVARDLYGLGKIVMAVNRQAECKAGNAQDR